MAPAASHAVRDKVYLCRHLRSNPGGVYVQDVRGACKEEENEEKKEIRTLEPRNKRVVPISPPWRRAELLCLRRPASAYTIGAMRKKTRFEELKDVFKTLHGPRGCMWDKAQTHRSLIPHLREEVKEFISAVKRNDPGHMQEELGDLLLHVMFNAQIAVREKTFDIEDVIDTLIKKLKRRHPHVFGTAKVRSTRQIIRNWHRIKEQEKKNPL